MSTDSGPPQCEPRLGGVSRHLLISILETDSLVHKLIGMPLMVESNAWSIFSALGQAKLEPVLTELLPYYSQRQLPRSGFVQDAILVILAAVK